MVGKFILGCIGLYIVGGIIKSWNLAGISVRKRLNSYADPKNLSTEHSGMILNVLSIESNKIQIAVWDYELDHAKEKIWFKKESIPFEWRNVGAWFIIKVGAGGTMSFEEYVVPKGDSPFLDGLLC